MLVIVSESGQYLLDYRTITLKYTITHVLIFVALIYIKRVYPMMFSRNMDRYWHILIFYTKMAWVVQAHLFVENNGQWNLNNQWQGCWWPGDTICQNINHDIEVVSLWYSGFGTTKIWVHEIIRKEGTFPQCNYFVHRWWWNGAPHTQAVDISLLWNQWWVSLLRNTLHTAKKKSNGFIVLDFF